MADREIVCRQVVDDLGRRRVEIVEAPLYAQISHALLKDLTLAGLDVWLTPEVVYTVIEIKPYTVRVKLKEDRRAYPR